MWVDILIPFRNLMFRLEASRPGLVSLSVGRSVGQSTTRTKKELKKKRKIIFTTVNTLSKWGAKARCCRVLISAVLKYQGRHDDIVLVQLVLTHSG